MMLILFESVKYNSKNLIIFNTIVCRKIDQFALYMYNYCISHTIPVNAKSRQNWSYSGVYKYCICSTSTGFH